MTHGRFFGTTFYVIASLIIATTAAVSSPYRPLPPDPPASADRPVAGAPGRAGLPYAFGRQFLTLNEYLLHLQRRAGPIGLPWWRRIGPDRFEQVTGRKVPPGRREVATRAELRRRYGFDR